MIAFPKLTEQELLDRIRIPSEGKLNIFLDTDTYNEIDDQFAILYAMLSPERLCLKGISAALFFNDRSASPVSYTHLKGNVPKQKKSGSCFLIFNRGFIIAVSAGIGLRIHKSPGSTSKNRQSAGFVLDVYKRQTHRRLRSSY